MIPMSQTVTLEKVRVGIEVALSHTLLMDPSVDLDVLLNEAIVAKVRGFVLGRTLERQQVSFPSDWWQSFKARWFPRWAKRRWPVKFDTVMLEAKALYPEANIAVPKELGKVVVAVMPPIRWGECSEEDKP